MSRPLDVRQTLVSGSFWIALSEVLKAVAELSGSIVTARVLAPEDFGLMGTVLLLLAILENFSHTGFEQALIQKQKEVGDYVHVAWSWHVLRGFGLALILGISAPFIADFYKQPLLKYLVWATTLHVLLRGFHSVGMIFFNRELNFKTICFVNILQAVVSAGVTIPVVLHLQNVWGLVIGLVASSLVTVLVSFWVHPWRPKFEWNFQKFKDLTNYGRWITGLSMIGFVVTQGDDIFVSKYLGMAALAFYQLAYSFSNLPATKITHVLSRVSFPTYARLQSDSVALRGAFLGVTRSTLVLSAPLSVGIWLVAPGFVEYVIGAKWSPILPLVEILVVAAFVRSFAALAGALFQACERPDLDFKMNLFRFVSMLILIWPLTAYAGLRGASWVVLIGILGCLPVWFYGVKKLTGVTIKEIGRVLMPALALALWLLGVWLVMERLILWGLGSSAWIYALQVLLVLFAWVGSTRLLKRRWPEVDLIGLLLSLKNKPRAT